MRALVSQIAASTCAACLQVDASPIPFKVILTTPTVAVLY